MTNTPLLKFWIEEAEREYDEAEGTIPQTRCEYIDNRLQAFEEDLKKLEQRHHRDDLQSRRYRLRL